MTDERSNEELVALLKTVHHAAYVAVAAELAERLKDGRALLAASASAEPVGYFIFKKKWGTWDQVTKGHENDPDVVPLYAAPCPIEAPDNSQLVIADTLKQKGLDDHLARIQQDGKREDGWKGNPDIAALSAPTSMSAVTPFEVDKNDPLWAKKLYENMRDAHDVYEKNPPPPQPDSMRAENRPAQDDVRDAQRYRWAVENWFAPFDEARLDAAIASQSEQSAKEN